MKQIEFKNATFNNIFGIKNNQVIYINLNNA